MTCSKVYHILPLLQRSAYPQISIPRYLRQLCNIYLIFSSLPFPVTLFTPILYYPRYTNYISCTKLLNPLEVNSHRAAGDTGCPLPLSIPPQHPCLLQQSEYPCLEMPREMPNFNLGNISAY
jgi:hypothetical protein